MDRTLPSGERRRIVFLTPTLTPVGGVVKVFDYASHALDAGWEVVVACPDVLTDDAPINDIPHLGPTLESVRFHEGSSVPLSPDDVVVLSWPTDYQIVAGLLPLGFPHDRIVHLVQNVRHANPVWIDGYATRLLGRPMTRIMITEQVADVCDRWVNRSSITETIMEGHAADFFSLERSGGFPMPIRVGYTTWKSDVGVAVEEALADDPRFVFDSIREPAGWSKIRELYHHSDVFLGCPSRQEGFYLVGLEAMAAGAIVLMPDAGGNLAYARWDQNCLLVEFDDVESYVARLLELAVADVERIEELRSAAYDTPPRFSLEAERRQFQGLLGKLQGLDLRETRHRVGSAK